MTRIDPRIAAVTDRIIERSKPTRRRYLDLMAEQAERGISRPRLSCGNFAHGFAGSGEDQDRIRAMAGPNIGIVTAYNDMLSAHAPYGSFPPQMKLYAREVGATAQVAGGVPAMCDGVTQGRAGMELSLFSRDTIALSTAVSLSHDMFDAALLMGVCDKIVPGLLIGALSFGHLPVLFVPAGPMTSGLSNRAKVVVRERYANGEASVEDLLEAESASYHAPGTCTFYGTANSNQVLLEAMGLQLPGSSFVNPGNPLRAAFTREAVRRAASITTQGEDYRPIGRLLDERAIVNAIVALLATGGSTNHTIHFVAVARAAGLQVTWEDFDAIARAVPLLSRIYPNGDADVNQFAAAGGTAFVFRELLDGGLLHEDIETIVPGGMRAYCDEPRLDGDALVFDPVPTTSRASEILRPLSDPFDSHGGIALLQGNLGRSLGKPSAVKPEHRVVDAPARVFATQDEVKAAFTAGELARDVVCVLRFQGPQANGMPELHALTPILGLLQDRGYRVFPVNPQITGERVHGEFVWRELGQIGEPIDIVDIFRRPEAAGEAVDQAQLAAPGVAVDAAHVAGQVEVGRVAVDEAAGAAAAAVDRLGDGVAGGDRAAVAAAAQDRPRQAAALEHRRRRDGHLDAGSLRALED
ncbi:MAG: phosphogluconate dehydratase, partial [Proteobacteria bacterium]|nr:phosphogluconate dehydratase [Pseudomonadota bacterium]